jgi:hypothetical protein
MTLYEAPTTQDRIIRPPCAKCFEPEGQAKGTLDL